MKFAFAKADITPAKPVFMAGFGARTRKSEGVHDPIYAKAALLMADKPLLILTLDVESVDRSFVAGIRQAMEAAYGLHADEVLINCSHTHASIALTGHDDGLRDGSYSIGMDAWPNEGEQLDYAEDERLFRDVRAVIVRLAAECFAGLTEGRLQLAVGKSGFAISRRMMTQVGLIWRPNPEAVIDDELLVLKLTDQIGEVRGILYNYGCHPTAMGPDNYLISAEFPGAASRLLEEAYPGAAVMFLQGCGGELKPAKSANGDSFKVCTFQEMEEAGDDLATDVIGILERGRQVPVECCRFRTVLMEPFLYTEQTDIGHYERIAGDPDAGEYRNKAAGRIVRAIRDGTVIDRLPLHIAVWQLSETVRLVAIEGEVSTGYALLIKKLFEDGHTLVLGYTNGVRCYIPTRDMIAEGGYETESNYFTGLRGPFVPEIEDIIVGQIVKAGMLLRQGSVLRS